MAEDKFKLPQSSYEELAKIIKGYGNLTKPASLDEVSKLTGLHTTVVSRNAGFLIAIGVLEPGAKKAITEPGRALARALEHEIPEEIQRGWRDVVESNEFLTKLLMSIRIRKGMTEETLTSHIAYSAGQPKKSGFMTGARTTIDILRVAGTITEADGKILPNEGTSPVTPTPPANSPGPPESLVPAPKQPTQPTAVLPTLPIAAKTVVTPGAAQVQINIDLTVECKPEDLDDLGPKLRAILDSISVVPDGAAGDS